MDSSEVLMQVKSSTDAPQGWVVLPLLRSKLILGMIGWTIGTLLGMGLFVALALIVIPYNYEQGVAPALFSTILLGLLLFIGLGSVWAFFADMRRMLNLDRHIIIITPDEFVKQEGDKVIHVPLTHVRHVTARGAAPANQNYGSSGASERADHAMPSAGESMMGFFAGRGFTPTGMNWRRKRMRTPTSLAFVDSRDDIEVTVVTDDSYGDPFMIGALLKQYTRNAQSIA